MFVQKKNTASMIETLEGRQLLSATAVTADAGAALAAGAGKVSMQDFHFVMKVNKASPKLFAAEDGAAGISFVKKVDKPSPGLKVRFNDILISAKASTEPAAAGKVSMQDFHFVMKVNKASPK